METHDDWCNPADVAAVMERVDHPAIAVNWDAAHPVRTEGWTLADSYRTLRRWIRHTHVHDLFLDANRPDYTAFGTGDIDHKEVLALLRSGGYDGFSAANGSTGSRPTFTCRARSRRCAATSARWREEKTPAAAPVA